VRVAIIGEGQTEYYCLPTIAGRMGNVVVGHPHIRGAGADCDWDTLFHRKVVPLVIAMAARRPDKIVIVLDREERPDCPPDLATRGINVIRENCGYCLANCTVSVVISNKKFECLLFADYEAVDKMKILHGPVSNRFPATTDEQNVLSWIRHTLRPGSSYEKIRDGKFLAQTMSMNDPAVLARSKPLRKLVKELQPSQ